MHSPSRLTRPLAGLFLLLSIPWAPFVQAQVLSPAPAAAPVEEVEICWDDHNVPYILAQSDAGALYGQGWTMAECHGPILKFLYAKDLGYRARYFGGGAFFVENDFLVKGLGIPGIAALIHRNMPRT